MTSELFYRINFSIVILFVTIGFLVSLSTILIIIRHRQFHTFDHVLICNTCLGVLLHMFIALIGSIYGFNEYWSSHSFLCSFRAFIYNVSIAVICYSISLRALSHFFFVILYNKRFLLTWRTHLFLIVLNWIIGIIICLPPFFISNGYAYEQESRSCVVSSKMYLLSLYILVVSSIIPYNIVLNLSLFILCYVKKSTRRIQSLTQNVHQFHSKKRDIKLTKQMLFETNVVLSGGPIFIFLVFWNATQNEPLPDFLYALAFTALTFAISFGSIIQFIINEPLVKYVRQLF